MNRTIRKLGVAVMLMMAASVSLMAQDQDSGAKTRATEDWEPIGVWPFIYKNFRTATVETGLFNKTETTLPCNIHVGKNALWFSKDNETLMEAIADNVRQVRFENGDVYIPIGENHAFARVLYEGELQGKTARVYLLKHVNQNAVDQNYLDYLNKTQNMLQGGSGSFFSHLADDAEIDEPEKKAVPLDNVFYFYFNGDLFEATTKNILNHIKQDRRREYRAYTRSAEVLSYSEKSMMGVWNDFFVNYDKAPSRLPQGGVKQKGVN